MESLEGIIKKTSRKLKEYWMDYPKKLLDEKEYCGLGLSIGAETLFYPTMINALSKNQLSNNIYLSSAITLSIPILRGIQLYKHSKERNYVKQKNTS